jgi:PAP2 superfamily
MPKWRRIIKPIALTIALVLAFLVGLARFYVGVHTINQILYGWLWGLWLALYFHYCLRVYTLKLIHTILKTEDSSSFKMPLLLSTLFALVVFFSQLATYWIVDTVF